MRAVCVRGSQPSGLNKKNLSDSTVASYPGCGISLLLGEGGGAYARDKNTSAVLCAKNAGGLMREGGRIWGTRDIPCSPTPVSPTPISPTLDKKVVFRLLIKNSSICNVLNINDLLNIQHNNNTTLPQYLYISVCRHSLYIFL